ncbi:integrase core domain-containing protein [Micromonospora sp. NPDC092111]|uniref:integrase core domain-containing protein n=1 Tax=Micromonospora sp. NPDC092111 TaxID=3364289 RepID=UPI0037F19C0B
MTVYRILVRHGLIEPVARRRGRKDYRRWERARPMELWQMDIVGGVFLADGSEAKVVTGVDDHSRFCVIAQVVRRATGRAVCLAFAGGLRRFGVPEEVLTDNGKQFTDRFGKGGEVMFDRICRENGIIHRLTQPASPTTTGKVERFHQTLRRELLDDVPVWPDLDTAQAVIDVFRDEYNTDRPHQSLDMAFPADRFSPAMTAQQVVPVKLPARLTQPGRSEPHLATPARPGCGAGAGGAGGGGVRAGRSRLGQHAGLRKTVLARPHPLWDDGDILGRHRRHPLAARRHPDQVRAVAPVRQRPGRTAPRRRPTRRATTPATSTSQAAHWPGGGRPDHRRQRLRLAGPAPGPGRRNPRRSPRRGPHRGTHPGLLRPRHPRTPPHPPQPIDPRAGGPTTKRPPRRPTTTTSHRTSASATAGLQQRRGHGRRPEDRPRPGPRPQDPHHRRHRHRAVHPLRRRHPHRPTHHPPARPQPESQAGLARSPSMARSTVTRRAGRRTQLCCLATGSLCLHPSTRSVFLEGQDLGQLIQDIRHSFPPIGERAGPAKSAGRCACTARSWRRLAFNTGSTPTTQTSLTSAATTTPQGRTNYLGQLTNMCWDGSVKRGETRHETYWRPKAEGVNAKAGRGQSHLMPYVIAGSISKETSIHKADVEMIMNPMTYGSYQRKMLRSDGFFRKKTLQASVKK